MPLTRCGDDQAIRIPAELAYEDMTVEFSITRHGDIIVIAPVRPPLTEMVAQLRAVPKPASVEVYEPIDLPDASWTDGRHTLDVHDLRAGIEVGARCVRSAYRCHAMPTRGTFVTANTADSVDVTDLTIENWMITI